MKNHLVSVENAQSIITKNSVTLGKESISLNKSLGQVISDDIFSPIDMPPFNQSAMDGFAIQYANGKQNYKLVGVIKAGDSVANLHLRAGEAYRIFTGAMVPTGADTIVKQEIVLLNGTDIVITDKIERGENLRLRGEQIKKGELALTKGCRMNPAAIGFLNGLGITEISVNKKPRIAVISTGNELIQPGEELTSGKIYESNSHTLLAALNQYGFDSAPFRVEDDYIETINVINEALKNFDLILLTGGISVGDYDFVGKALTELEVKTLFYKVKQKPGKPLYFGRKHDKIVFGLPGNPAAALTCFYVYVLPLLFKLIGREDRPLKKQQFKLDTDYSKTTSIAHFLKAKHSGDQVSILGAQSSAMLSSFTNANCLIHLPEGQSHWEIENPVDAYLID